MADGFFSQASFWPLFITVSKQLVLHGGMPSALQESAQREKVVLHTGRTDSGRIGDGGSLVLRKDYGFGCGSVTLPLSW